MSYHIMLFAMFDMRYLPVLWASGFANMPLAQSDTSCNCML